MVIRSLKNAATYLLKKIDFYSFLALKAGGQLKDAGWFESFRLGAPVDKNGNPLPWVTYSAISFLEKRVNRDMTIFEYGCGNSTLWWAKRVKKVVCCEHNRSWYDRIKALLPGNVELHQVNLEYGGAYSRKISGYQGVFDIVVIDGRDRINCIKNSLKALTKRGVLILDDSDRESYREGYNFLNEHGFKRIDFEGMGPVITISWCTSIFYKKDNCLNI